MVEPRLFPSNVQPRRRKALNSDDVDKLGQALLTLASELWAVKDRQFVTEAILKARGIDISEDIDTFTPDPELEAKLMHERQTLIKKLALDISGEYGPLE